MEYVESEKDIGVVIDNKLSTRAIYQTILVMHVHVHVCPFVGLHSRIVEIYP
jgi:hypothetical protein